MGSPPSGWEGLIWIGRPKEVAAQQWTPRAPLGTAGSAKLLSAKIAGAEFALSENTLRTMFKGIEEKYSTFCLQSLPRTNPLALCLLEGKNITLQPFLSNNIS